MFCKPKTMQTKPLVKMCLASLKGDVCCVFVVIDHGTVDVSTHVPVTSQTLTAGFPHADSCFYRM